MSNPDLDHRLHAFRADLADARLKDRVQAPRYATGARAQLIHPIAPLKMQPHARAQIGSEVLYGERLHVFDRGDDWAWVQLERDGYVGYVPSNALTDLVEEPTHRVQALGTFAYPAPDIKVPPAMHLSLGSELAIESQDGKFAKLRSGLFIIDRHIVALDRPQRDFVTVAERFIGIPYLWGGRSCVGLDCSGLVQLALEAAGCKAPRDSDLQEALGRDVPIDEDLEGLARGDLVFWSGHVGIMVDSLLMIHANAHYMCVVVEPLPVVVERSRKAGELIRAVRRLEVHTQFVT